MKNDFKKKKIIAILILGIFLVVSYAGFRYWQYMNSYGITRNFTGKVTLDTEDDSVCRFFEIDKNTLVRLSCDKEQLDLANSANKQYRSDNGITIYGDALKMAPFDGQYDKDIKVGDTVQIRAVRINPNGSTKYKFYEIRDAGTYIKRN